MLPLKKIVCPTDFSEPSFKALLAAEELAQHFSAELVLVHVVDLIPTLPASHLAVSPLRTSHAQMDVAAYQEAIRQHAKEAMEQAVANKLSGQVQLRQLIVPGSPAHMIVQTATEEKADLVVIATHGRTGVSRFLFGSVAEKVVRTAECPVLTVHMDGDEEAQQD